MRVLGWPAVGVLGSLFGASAATAAPTVRVVAEGACPDAAAVIAALPRSAQVVAGADADVTIAVADRTDGVAVTLTAGQRRDHSLLDGHDCAALAGAVAALADAWLVELIAPPAPPPPVARPPSSVRTPGAVPRWYVGAARAIVIDSAAERGAATELDVAWRSTWQALRLRARFDWGDAATLDAAAGATRQPWNLIITAGWRLRQGRAWTEAGLGGGAVLSRVDSMASRGAYRMHPVGAATAAVGVTIGAGVSVRLEVAALAYPIADRYLVAAAEVGRSPWAGVSTGLGLDIALGTP